MCGTRIIFFGLCELAALIQTVAYTVVGICQGRSILVAFQVDILAEAVLGFSVLFLFEVAVTQVVMSQGIHIRIALTSIVQIRTVI